MTANECHKEYDCKEEPAINANMVNTPVACYPVDGGWTAIEAWRTCTHWSVIEHRTRKQDIEVGKYKT